VSNFKTVPVFGSHFRLKDLLQRRRDILLRATNYPVGTERNQQRQIASSLRVLCRDNRWLHDNTLEGAESLAWPKKSVL
jgi:hypothetical protein